MPPSPQLASCEEVWLFHYLLSAETGLDHNPDHVNWNLGENFTSSLA